MRNAAGETKPGGVRTGAQTMMTSKQAYHGPSEAAQDLHRRGFAVIRVPFKQKNPNRPAWQHERLDEADLRAVFAGKCNIGILTGEPSGGRVDVDLDCPEAIQLADVFLPESACTFGRASKPRSHRIYIAPGTTYAKLIDPAKDENGEQTTIVELRETGKQSIAPGSVHPSGERVRWDQAGEPAEVETDQLRIAVLHLAAAALLARHWPGKGTKHDARLALAGGLLHAGWSTDATYRFVYAVAAAGGDTDLEDVRTSVTDTAEKIRAGKNTTGWPKLSKRVNERVIDRVREWLDLHGGEGRDGQSPSSSNESSEHATRKSQATLLVELVDAGDVDIFHTPDGHAYATVPISDHHETLELNSKVFRTWLTRRYYDRHRATPGSQAVQDAINNLHGKALFSGTERPVFVRLAGHENVLYLDLGDAAWRVVRITAGGWSVIAGADAPVRFRRPKTLEPLPEPVSGSSLTTLFDHITVTDVGDQKRILGWLIGTFQQHGGRAILELNGEQGSAKSTTARMLRRIVDPSTSDLRSKPRDERDLVIAASNGLVVGIDNLSGMPDWLSDALCRLSTGGGIGGRELYTNTDEVVLDAQRPSILTGINQANSRGDRLDRTIGIVLPRIPKDKRKPETAMWSDFRKAQPALLGALLDAVVVALGRYRDITRSRMPRLADFALWVEASAPALGWKPYEFLDALEAASREADEFVVDMSPIGPAIRTLMKDKLEWSGFAIELLAELRSQASDDTARDKAWPKQANHLSNELNRLAPSLRVIGIDVSRGAGRDKRRIYLTAAKNSSANDRHDRHHRHRATPVAQESPMDQGFSLNGAHDDQPALIVTGSSPGKPMKPPLFETRDDGGDGDGQCPSSSKSLDLYHCAQCGGDLPDDGDALCYVCGDEAPDMEFMPMPGVI